MAEQDLEWDNKNFNKALKEYLDIRKNVDPPKELKRRAKNIGIRLIKIYKDKGVKLSDITAKGNILKAEKRLKIRPKIRAKSFTAKTSKKGKVLQGSYDRMAQAELNARRSAKGFTSTGWFPSVEKLGGSPKRQVRAGTGPKRGKLIEKLSGSDISETLVNQQPGAAHVMEKDKSDCQKAVDQETEDIVKFIAKKQNDAARKVGLV